MVGGAEHAAEHFQHAFFDFGAGVVLTPGMPHQLGRAFAIALRQQGARKHIAALGGGGLLLREECTHRAIVDAVVPQRILSAAAKQWRVRPARICSDEGRVTLERRIGIVGTQDHPFGKLACDGIADARLRGIGLGFLALAGSLDHAFHSSNVGFRSCCRRRDREGAGGRPRERFEEGARLGDRAAQPDIGLREGCEARTVGIVGSDGGPLLRKLSGRRSGRYHRRLFDNMDSGPRARQWNFLWLGRRRLGRQRRRGRQRQTNAQAAASSRLHSTPFDSQTRRPRFGQGRKRLG